MLVCVCVQKFNRRKVYFLVWMKIYFIYFTDTCFGQILAFIYGIRFKIQYKNHATIIASLTIGINVE